MVALVSPRIFGSAASMEIYYSTYVLHPMAYLRNSSGLGRFAKKWSLFNDAWSKTAVARNFKNGWSVIFGVVRVLQKWPGLTSQQTTEFEYRIDEFEFGSKTHLFSFAVRIPIHRVWFVEQSPNALLWSTPTTVVVVVIIVSLFYTTRLSSVA